MNREYKREMERQRQRAEAQESVPEAAARKPADQRERTSARQFLREVRGEMKRVAWPSRKEVTSYSLVVLVAVSLVTLFVFGLDQAFGQLIFRIFA